MNSMERRMKALEKKAWPSRDEMDVTIVRFIAPLPNLSGPDPNTLASGFALIRTGPNAGMTLHPYEGEKWDEFNQRVDEAKVA